ncbi:(2Fe-2S) ferredoxin domain-containing protein [Gordonia humi]|uniref:(2Fe-2S) ferredoxin n=1 Tax=Gordonia humi TaxID=686429 RepID=A0A840F6E9_9ACTN|nr:(2Fe-2S) ferredoxin domain-containing protein [Gordonia humi]MBB4137466.1 (2Fe-2S) ferredoxin [Gordonia humi]
MSVDWMIVTVPTDRDIDPANELAAAVRALGERRPDIEFRTAVLTGGGTTVTEALDAAADAGARTVLVQSAQTVDDRASNAWFRRVIGHWVREHTDGPHVRLGPSFARTRAYVDLLAEAIDDGGVPARDTTAPLTSPAWEDVPAFSRHVLICRGPRCSARGSGEMRRAFGEALDARGLGDDDVLVTVTGCLYPCNRAPVAAVYPDNVWYGRLTADRVERVIDRHLVGGEPVAEWSASDGGRRGFA